MNDIYIPLHVHTTKGSVGDSILKIDDYIKKAKEFKLPAIAETNHGSMSDMFEFYKACKDNDIKPIIGCEVYETTDRTLKSLVNKKRPNAWHLVLLAKNKVGMENLLYITSNAQLEGYYYKPRTDIEILREHGEGIIALSACLGSKLKYLINNNETDRQVIEAINEYKEIFDDFYLEIQPGDFDEQIQYNKKLIELSSTTNTSLIVTNDVHYLNSDDWKTHDAHVKIHRKMKINEAQVYPDKCYYLQDYNTITNSLSYLPYDIVKQAIANTVKVANEIILELDITSINMPKYNTMDFSEESTLITMCHTKLKELAPTLKDPANYASRLERELKVINQLGFSGYFLIVADFVDYAQKNNIPVGPGRGSACGSLAAYLMDITKVDPVKYNLLFERFLSPHRKSIPDIDLDFASDKRTMMFDYAVKKYGSDHCALVSTLGMRKAKASIRDAARIYDIDKDLADQAAKLIPQVFYGDEGEKTTDLSIEESISLVPSLKELSLEHPLWFETAMKLENLPKSSSIHAAGTIVSSLPLQKYIPLRKPKSDTILATELNLASAEMAGFVKFDFLSLATLTVIDNTLKDMNIEFDFTTNEYDDEKVWKLIGSKNTTGLFQIASKTYKERMPRLKPKNIKELAACLALVRGPCIQSGDDKKYMDIIEGKREIELIHPFYDDVTADTKGILLYQEQIMQVAVNFGFSKEKSYDLMKAIAKKKIGKIKEFENSFYELAKIKKIPKKAVDRIWQIFLDAGLYAFNASHAVAYAFITYQSAYLKTFYPVAYMKNTLTNTYLRKEDVVGTLMECRRLGIKFLPLDISKSKWGFLQEDNKIRIGMCAIRGFGKKAADAVIELGTFISFDNFYESINKTYFNKAVMILAIFAGMFDNFNDSRIDLLDYYMSLRKEETPELIKLKGKDKTFKINDPEPRIEEMLLGEKIITHPVNSFEKIGFESIKTKQKFVINAVVSRVKKLRDKNGNMMAFLSLETADGTIDSVMFSHIYKDYKRFCKKNLIVKVSAIKNKEDSCIVNMIK